MVTEGIYAVQSKDSKGRIYVNLYAIDSEYGADELNDYNLDRAIQKSDHISYEYHSLYDIESAGEEMIYEELSDDFKEDKIRSLEGKIRSNKTQIEFLKSKTVKDAERFDESMREEMVSGYRIQNKIMLEYEERQLKLNEKMLKDVQEDKW